MITPGKERQRRYKERQAVHGKKTITVNLSMESYNILNEEKGRTGGNFSAIVDRAVVNLSGSVTSDRKIALPVTSDSGIIIKEYHHINEYIREGYQRIASEKGIDAIELMEDVLKAVALQHEIILAGSKLKKSVVTGDAVKRR